MTIGAAKTWHYLHKFSLHEKNVVPARALCGNVQVKLKSMRLKSDVYNKSPLLRGLEHWNRLPPETQTSTTN